MPRVDPADLHERHKKWQSELARPRKRVAAMVIEDDDPYGQSASAFRRRLERAREYAAHLYLKPMMLPANGASSRKLISGFTIAEHLDRDDVRPCYVWQANSPKAIRAVMEDLDEPGIAVGGGHAWTVMGDRDHYHRPGAYVLAASRRLNTPTHGVLFASRALLVEPNPFRAGGALPILQIELDYIYVRRRMRRRGIACALAAAVVDQAKTDLWHLYNLIVARPKRDRKLAIWLHAEAHTKGGNQFVSMIFDALDGYIPVIADDRIENCGVLDHVDWI